MIWIDYVLLAFLAVMIFGIGFFCGYVKDKKEVADDLRAAKEYSEEAEKRLNEAQRLLDKAHNYYEEVHAELERLKEDWGVVTTEGE
jgi:cellobiose-specific phosphotransferase system component IIA